MAAKKEATAPAIIESESGQELAIPASVSEMVVTLRARATDTTNAEQTTIDILAHILGGTLEEALEGGSVDDVDDWLDTLLTFRSVSWNKSDVGRFGVYAVVHAEATMSNGDERG